jgi:DNA-binding beta-propeller fold protein YncE
MLRLLGHIALPPHATGGFDHGDVHVATGRVFVAHTPNGTVEVIDGERLEVIDGERLEFIRTIQGCPEGSGVLCTPGSEELEFAASRGAGKVLVLDPDSFVLRKEVRVGPKPNGLAWDPGRRQLLVADVEDYRARLVDPLSGTTLASTLLPGRPRWCVFDRARDRFLVNIREPACVVGVAGGTGDTVARIDVSANGPHGLDLDSAADRAFVACDAGTLVVLDLKRDCEVGSMAIAGEPDAIWFNAQRNLLYVAIGTPGLIDVVDCAPMSIAQRIETEAGAHTTAFDSRRQLLYVFLPGSSLASAYQEEVNG